MKSIALIGMRASGKSTLGPILARHLGLGFTDLDEVLGFHRHAHDILRAEGEAALRQREETALLKIPATNWVLACGGGTIVSQAARKWLKQKFFVIWLQAEPALLVARRAGDDRPLLNQAKNVREEVELHMQTRLQHYSETANLIYHMGSGSPEAEAELLLQQMMETR